METADGFTAQTDAQFTAPLSAPVDDLLERFREANGIKKKASIVEDLIALHGGEADGTQDDAPPAEVRHAFVSAVRDSPALLDREAIAKFLAQSVQPEDFDTLQWEATDHMIEFCEVLYGFRFPTEAITERVREHVRLLLRRALQQHEEQDELEEMFRLLRIAPTAPLMNDVELMRLRHVARAYEIHRIRRNRRWLYAYLAVQALLVLWIFPLLFINAENGQIQRQVEELADVKLGDEGYIAYTFTEGLYWSTITAGSIGYGDITPRTTTGRILASILGTMGVITIGVMAGLILQLITPRGLD